MNYLHLMFQIKTYSHCLTCYLKICKMSKQYLKVQ